MPAYSLLDLCPLLQGQPAALTFEHSKALAQAAEEHGYTRYWLAEHHNMSSIGSSATSVVMGHVAAATRSIRIGSGGVMLPNHAPLVIADGDTVTISTAPPEPFIEDDEGDSLLGQLTSRQFWPLVPGTNSISVALGSTTGNTRVDVTWRCRFDAA